MSKSNTIHVLAAGTLLQQGKYRLENLMGQSAMTQTYAATHGSLGHRVVLKTLNDRREIQSHRRTYLQRFTVAAQTFAQLQHPNLVRVNDFFIESERPFIVTDFVVGQPLDQGLDKHPLGEPLALTYIRQLGQVVAGMHHLQWLHRDLHPGNILRHPTHHTITLVNLGLAKTLAPEHTGPLAEGFAPLEQYIPRHQLTPTADIYALAAVLYTLLTGRKPVPSVLRDQMPLVPPRQLVAHISPQTEKAILQGMALQASERPTTIEQWLSLLPTPAASLSISPASVQHRPSEQVTSQQPSPLEPQPSELQPQASGLQQGTETPKSTAVAVPPSPTQLAAPVSPTPRRFPGRALTIWALVSGCCGLGAGLLFRWHKYQPFATLPDQAEQPTPGVQQEAFPPRIRPLASESQPQQRPQSSKLLLDPAAFANVDAVVTTSVATPEPIVRSQITKIPDQLLTKTMTIAETANPRHSSRWREVLPQPLDNRPKDNSVPPSREALPELPSNIEGNDDWSVPEI